ncbi:amiloride-sensitive sodium channel subunit alpha-like [Heterodontus francisci]|uniref:amiloride-sensitive sodium channel subunit alpha-like n=1 Tax=Heterodontus francisci TaxID=7792 RepID=UPI00355C2326
MAALQAFKMAASPALLAAGMNPKTNPADRCSDSAALPQYTALSSTGEGGPNPRLTGVPFPSPALRLIDSGSTFRVRRRVSRLGGVQTQLQATKEQSKHGVCAMPEKRGTEAEEEEERGREGLIELHRSYREILQFFCANTTIHGAVRLICSERNHMKTTFWAMLMSAFFGVMYWQFGLIFGQYFRYPVTISMAVDTKTLTFPAVTVCTLNPHRYESVRAELHELDLLTEEALYTLYGYKGPQRKAARRPAPAPQRRVGIPRRLGLRLIDPGRRHAPSLDIGGRRSPGSNGTLDAWLHNPPLRKNSSWKIGFELCNETGSDCFHNWHSSGVDAISEWYTFHYLNVMSLVPRTADPSEEARLAEFVFDCKFNGMSCSKSNFTTFPHPIYGNCYTFNGINSTSPWHSSLPGKESGLSLLLKIQQKDYIPLLSTVAGARVAVHEQNKAPFMEDGGFDIRPGVETSISMRQELVSRLEGHYSDCTQDGREIGVGNLYKSGYTQQACVRSCFQLTMVSRCGCAYYFYPLPDGAEYCNYNKHAAWGHCYYRLSKDFSADELGCFRTCRKLCQQTEYQMTAGYANWPSHNSGSWIYPILREENQFVTSNRKELAKLNLFFQELNYKTMSETPAVPMAVMLSNLGGQWSLWFGSSVLSVVEILELLLDMAALTAMLGLGALRSRLRPPPAAPPVPEPPAPCLPHPRLDPGGRLGSLDALAGGGRPPAYESLGRGGAGLEGRQCPGWARGAELDEPAPEVTGTYL